MDTPNRATDADGKAVLKLFALVAFAGVGHVLGFTVGCNNWAPRRPDDAGAILFECGL